MSIGLEVNHCLFLLGQDQNVGSVFECLILPLSLLKTIIQTEKKLKTVEATNLKVREHVGMVSNEESVGHVGQLLRVLLGYFRRGRLLVCDDVIHEGSPTGSRVP